MLLQLIFKTGSNWHHLAQQKGRGARAEINVWKNYFDIYIQKTLTHLLFFDKRYKQPNISIYVKISYS